MASPKLIYKTDHSSPYFHTISLVPPPPPLPPLLPQPTTLLAQQKLTAPATPIPTTPTTALDYYCEPPKKIASFSNINAYQQVISGRLMQPQLMETEKGNGLKRSLLGENESVYRIRM